MIVKDEEAVLERCLRCAVRFADELIIVDTGSSDKTKQIAAAYTKHVYDMVWENDFSKARNFSFEKASCDYCMWLDGDDTLQEKDIQALKRLKQTLPADVSVVMMNYHTAFDEAGKPVFSYYRERMVRRSDGLRWEGRIHETLPLLGKLYYSDIAIEHHKPKSRRKDTDRNLRIYEEMREKKELFGARDFYYYGRELYDHQRYEDAIHMFQHVLNDATAWKEYKIGACELLAYSYMTMKKKEQAIESFMKSFLYDEPRGEACCGIGDCFLQKKAYLQAVWWYERAEQCRLKETSGAFIRKDCYDFLPALQLCVCWWYLGEKEKALQYHKKAKALRPKHPSVLQNERFFKELKEI